jgi:hypothetical protein
MQKKRIGDIIEMKAVQDIVFRLACNGFCRLRLSCPYPELIEQGGLT